MNQEILFQISELQVATAKLASQTAKLASQKEAFYELCRDCKHEWSKGVYSPKFKDEYNTLPRMFYPCDPNDDDKEVLTTVEIPRWRHECPICKCFAYSEKLDSAIKGLFINPAIFKPDTQLGLVI